MVEYVLDKVCEKRHSGSAKVALEAREIAQKNRERLISVAGEDGDGGRMKAMESKLDKVAEITYRTDKRVALLALKLTGAFAVIALLHKYLP